VRAARPIPAYGVRVSTLVEICLEDVGGAALAAAAGADGLEVCAGLADGGTTPTLGFVRHCADAAPGLEIRVLVRGRPGDFEATRAALGGSARLGFVIGTLEPDGTIAARAVRRLVAACGDAPVTFHKAFDSVPDKVEGLALLGDLGVTRVLASGGPGPALDHLPVLADLVRRGGDEVRIAVGGGVRPANAARIVAETGAREVHLRAPGEVRPAGVSAGYDDGRRSVTSAEVLAEVMSALGR
jgi:copper homeostasis protein